MPHDWHNPILGGCRHDTYTKLRGVFEALSSCLPSFHHLHIFLPGRLSPGFLSLSTPGLHHNHQGSLVHQLPPPTRPSAVHHHAALTSAGLAWYYKKAAGSLPTHPCLPFGSPLKGTTSKAQSHQAVAGLAPAALSPHPLDSGHSASLTSLQSSRSLRPQAAAQAVPSASHTLPSATPFS